MSDQAFLTYAFDNAEQRNRVTARLQAEKFATYDARRAVSYSLNIRIRTQTGDQAEVERIITELAPNADRLPSGSPTVGVVGYREGL
jgi:Tfp pilus assembly protein PilF